MRRLDALIVGAGRIGGANDEGRDGPGVLSHAGAYRKDGRFRLRACVEPNETRRAAFMDYWGAPDGYATLDDALSDGRRYDVISVCVPDRDHEAALEAILPHGPKAVFCEKPLTLNTARSRALVEEYRKAGITLAVNYNRRWDPAMERLRNDLADRKVQWATLHYVKGLKNNASHGLDLFDYLLGPLEPKIVTRTQYDFYPHDPTLDAVLEAPNGAPVHLIGADGSHFEVFEIHIATDLGMISLEDYGYAIRARGVGSPPRFPEDAMLEKGVWSETELDESFPRAIDNIYRAVEYGAPLAATGDSAVRVLELCDRLRSLSDSQEAD